MCHLDQRAFALVERLPVRIKAVHVLLVEGKHDSQCIGQQHTGLLEKFAYGCGPQSCPQRSESFGIGCHWRYRRTDAFRLLRAAVICCDGATWKDVYIWQKMALDDSSYHKYFYSL